MLAQISDRYHDYLFSCLSIVPCFFLDQNPYLESTYWFTNTSPNPLLKFFILELNSKTSSRYDTFTPSGRYKNVSSNQKMVRVQTYAPDKCRHSQRCLVTINFICVDITMQYILSQYALKYYFQELNCSLHIVTTDSQHYLFLGVEQRKAPTCIFQLDVDYFLGN